MPKVKTHRGAAKRFKKTASGRIKARRGFRAHINTKMTTKRKRKLRTENCQVSEVDKPSVNRLLRGC